ncbi:MAG TPA: ChbG/HpnK family deacetylase [Candidatus Acidoferrales bacterium]|nr:ChbG/HpnK family deacetylase [Candidatus Acidoferrales bacterium]
MPRRLVVNADGFGFGPGATAGIIDAIRQGGFISSVSVNANFPEARRVRELLDAFPAVSIGVHLNPIAGRPCLSPKEVPSLVDRDGFFHGKNFLPRLRAGLIDRAELKAELDAQIALVKRWAGERLTHLDSQAHHHLYELDLFLALARKWNIRRMRNNASLICLESPMPGLSRRQVYLRRPHVWLAHRYRQYQMWRARRAGMRMADRLVTVGYGGEGNKTELKNWLRVLENLPAGTYEIFCHPAYPDETLRRWASYCEERAKELAVLCTRHLFEIARKLGVEIVSFNAI